MKNLLIIALPVFLAACAPLMRPEPNSQALPHHLRVRHPGVHTERPTSCTLYQINDKKGFPSEYRMTVDSVICPEQTCRLSTVTMVWDALGHYQRFGLPPGEILEKGVPASQRKAPPAAPWKGVPFTEADYRKLDEILQDEHSLLGQQKLVGLSGSRDKDLVDGITGATPATVRDAVVAGASLTCYNLWHWANGEVAAAAKELTHRQCGEAMLLSFLSSDKPHYVLFALDHLRLHKLFGASSVEAVRRAMAGGDRERIDRGLAYLREALPEPDSFYENVGALINASSGGGRAYLLDRLASEKALPGAFFDTLGAGLPSWNSYYEIHLCLQLAERRGQVSPALITQTAKLLDNPDFFIARRAHGFLSSQSALDAQTAARLQVFRDKAAREGRSL